MGFEDGRRACVRGGRAGHLPRRQDGVVRRDGVGGRAVGDSSSDAQEVPLLHACLPLLLCLDGSPARRRALHVRACPDGMADEAAWARAQSLRPHRAFCGRMVRVSARRALLPQELGEVRRLCRVLRRHVDCCNGRDLGACRVVVRGCRRRRGGCGVPRFAGRRMGCAEGHPLRHPRRDLLLGAILVPPLKEIALHGLMREESKGETG